MSETDHLAVGRIVRPHGVRGELIVEPYSETIRSIEADSEVFIESVQTPFKVLALRSHQRRLILRIEGCEDREAAEGFRGNELLIPTPDVEPLPDGVYYRWQILGLTVNEENGRYLGTVVDILETGANDVYIIRGDDARELLLPAIKDVILEVDLEGAQLLVRMLDGLE
jgi:16S rRNA processing protein RimM